MNIFCRIFGHTWVPQTEDPVIRWNTETKKGLTLIPTAKGEPHFYEECARCHERREWERRKTSATS